MRTLVLSVCVGLLLSACDGSVDSASEEVRGGEAGAGSSVASGHDAAVAVATPQPDGGEALGNEDAATSVASDAGPVRDGGARDAGSERDAGPRDAGARDAGNGGGAVDAGASVPDAGSGGNNNGKPIFVVAGYQSGIAFSKDLGLTWTNARAPTAPYGDNPYVLSGAAFAKGTFVVVGYDIFTSTDGEHWTQRTSAGSEWLGSLNFGNGVFAGTGGTGFSQWSDDGITWHKGMPSLGVHSDTSAFGNGMFMAAVRSGDWWSSADGKSWTKASGQTGHSEKIVWCVDHFADEADCKTLVPTGQASLGEGVWIRAQNSKQLRRSTNNGQTWSDVNVTFDANCVTFGYVP